MKIAFGILLILCGLFGVGNNLVYYINSVNQADEIRNPLFVFMGMAFGLCLLVAGVVLLFKNHGQEKEQRTLR